MSTQVRDYHTKDDFSADHVALLKDVGDGAVDEANFYGSETVSQSNESFDPPQDYTLYDTYSFADPPGGYPLIQDREALLAALLGLGHHEVEKPVDPYDAIIMETVSLVTDAEVQAEFEKWQARSATSEYCIDTGGLLETPTAAIASSIEVQDEHEQPQAISENPEHHNDTSGVLNTHSTAGRSIIEIQDGHEQSQARSEIPHNRIDSNGSLEVTALRGEVASSGEEKQENTISETTEQNINTNDLLHAAVTSAGREFEAQAIDNAKQRFEALGSFKRTFNPEQLSKRPREGDGECSSINPKRRKTTPPTRNEDEVARDRELWGDDDCSNEDGGDSPISLRQENPMAKGVRAHPAAVLFKCPSEASKNHSRVPMSKLFTSMELLPDDFLELQAAAKLYMLDKAHPERSECIGTQGRANADIVKLKLLETTRAFLEDEGWGARCFGEGTLKGLPRKLKWPEQRNKLISLVSPLLRRMLTNERQRQYAREIRNEKQRSATPSRKSPASTSELRKSTSPTPCEPKLNQYHGSATSSPVSSTATSSTPTGLSLSSMSKPLEWASPISFDPKEYQHPISMESPIRSSNLPSTFEQQNGTTSSNFPAESIRYYVNLLLNDRRIKPQLALSPSTCPGFLSLIRHIQNHIGEGGQILRSIRVLGPEGLREVRDENTWAEAISLIKKNEWMDGDVKCMVHLEELNTSLEIPTTCMIE